MSANNENPFIGEDYCVLNLNTLKGTSLLKAVKQAVLSNDAVEGRLSFVFKIRRDGGQFQLTEITQTAMQLAENEIRDLMKATFTYQQL